MTQVLNYVDIYALYSSIPAAAPATEGRLSLAQDRNLVYRDSGSAQEAFAMASPMTTAGDMIRGGTSGYPERVAVGTNGHVWTVTAGVPGWAAPATSGTVTSVALTMPADYSVAGSPITSSGTLAVTYANQNANTVQAGPSSGAAAAPTFRALVADDIPATFGEVPWAATADASVANTTTPTNILTANTGTKQIPAAFWAVGRSFRLTLTGYYEVDVSSPAGSATITLVLGSTTLATATFTFPADTATVADYFEIEAVSTCRVTGVSGSLMSQIRGGIHFPGADQPLWAVPAQPMTAVTMNISGVNNVALNWAWDVADPDNTVTCTNAILELL